MTVDDPDWRAFAVGLGSNLGDREGQAAAALALLRATGGVRRLRVSDPIVTAPVVPSSMMADHPPYLNAVVVGETRWSPTVFMSRLLAVESACGRRRRGAVAPRSLDLDLLLMDGVQASRVGLELPHPRLAGRDFVLAPLRDLLAGFASDEDASLRDSLVRALESAVEPGHR